MESSKVQFENLAIYSQKVVAHVYFKSYNSYLYSILYRHWPIITIKIKLDDR